MREGTKVNFQGHLYESIAELARAYNQPLASVFQRIKRGWSLEQAVLLEKAEKKTTGQQITLKGVTYSSRIKACEALGLDHKVVHHRLKAGRSIEEAFGLVDFDYASKPKRFNVEGKKFDSLVDACEHFGIDKYVLNARINRYGWTVEEALGVHPRPGYERGVAGYVYLVTHTATGKPYVGITMGSIEARWQQHIDKAFSTNVLSSSGLHHAIRKDSPSAFSIRLIDKAKTAGELSDKEVHFVRLHNTLKPLGYNLNSGGGGTRTKGRAVIVSGISFPSITAACKKFGVERRQTTERLTNGWSVEEAFGLEEKRDKFGPKMIVLGGVHYKSYSEAARVFGVDNKNIVAKKKKGWTIEQIFGLEDRENLKAIIFRGVKYASASALCRAYGVDRSRYSKRKIKGHTIEESLGLTSAE